MIKIFLYCTRYLKMLSTVAFITGNNHQFKLCVLSFTCKHGVHLVARSTITSVHVERVHYRGVLFWGVQSKYGSVL